MIQVAGTNGKGTFTSKTALALQLAGYRTGQFQSPHISSLRERILVDNEIVEKEFLEQFWAWIYKQQHFNQLSYFDFITLAALKYWEEKKVDVAVVEVGLGGDKDSTTAVNGQILTVITSIAKDHVQRLGPTLDNITLEKLGIAKPHVPLLVGPSVNYGLSKILANRKQSILHTLPNSRKWNTYQDLNKQLVVQGAEILKDQFNYAGFINQAFNTLQTGRFEIVRWARGKSIILDVGHNLDAIEQVAQRIKIELQQDLDKVGIVFGCKSIKDWREILLKLAHLYKKVYLVQPDSDLEKY